MKKTKQVPAGVFTPAESFVLFVAGETTAVRFDDILKACQAQRELDPKVTWIVREPDGVVLKIRNGTTGQLKRLVQRNGGHL